MLRLDQLRRRIAQLDSALLALVAERMELAREIGEEKLRLSLPLRDYTVERVVLERSQRLALELGVEPALAERLFLELVEGACSVQELSWNLARGDQGKRVLVVGGWGRMGRWLARFLDNQGHEIRILDPAAPPNVPGRVANLEEGLAGADLVLLAVPLEVVRSQLENIAAAGFRGVVADLASLKSPLLPAIEGLKRQGCRVASFHPLFGPDVQRLRGRVVLFCDCGDLGAVEALEELFSDTAVERVRLPIEDHDKIAAYVLGLSHLINLIFARVIAQSGFSCLELSRFGSATFQRQEQAARAVCSENPELYWAIQRLNPFTEKVIRELREALASWSGWIQSDHSEAFQEAMAEARRFFTDIQAIELAAEVEEVPSTPGGQ